MLYKQVSQFAAVILDQIKVWKINITRPKNRAQRSSYAMMRFSYKERRSIDNQNGCETLTASDPWGSLGQAKPWQGKKHKNSDELRPYRGT